MTWPHATGRSPATTRRYLPGAARTGSGCGGDGGGADCRTSLLDHSRAEGEAMRNPRPCICGHPRREHSLPLSSAMVVGYCRLCWGTKNRCRRYRPAPRKEPLRAPHRAKTLGFRRPGPLRARRLCPHGRPGVVNMVDFIGFGPFVESVPGRVECPPECHAA